MWKGLLLVAWNRVVFIHDWPENVTPLFIQSEVIPEPVLIICVVCDWLENLHWFCFYDTRGAFHSTKTSEYFDTRTYGTEISWERFGNCWISEKRTTKPNVPEIPEGKSNKMEIPSQKFRKISVYLAGLFCFILFHSSLEIPGNANRSLSSNGKCPRW